MARRWLWAPAMGLGHFLNHWWNVPYLVLLGVVAVFFGLQLLGLGDGDGTGDGVFDTAADEALAGAGVGRVPFMVRWVGFFLVAGFAGLGTNLALYLAQGGGYGPLGFAASLTVALAAGAAGSRTSARLAARWVDTGGGVAGKEELTGLLGTVASAQLGREPGEVRVKDLAGNEQLVHGRLRSGEPPAARGEAVVLAAYRPEDDTFELARLED